MHIHLLLNKMPSVRSWVTSIINPLMCFSPGKVLVPWPRGNGTDQAWSGLLWSPPWVSVSASEHVGLVPVITGCSSSVALWGALPPPQSMWPHGKGPVNGIRGVSRRSRSGGEGRWDSETRRKSPAHGSESSMAGIHVPFSVLYLLWESSLACGGSSEYPPD